MDKVEMISLWMAQGFLEPLDESQSLYDAGEECFSILLRRCFFQDVIKIRCGEILSFKMHDLMHDVAQEVAGHEICVANSSTSKMDERTRHVFAAKQECAKSSFQHIKIRTYLKGHEQKSASMDAIVRNGKYLRALELQWSGMKKLPCTIGRLLHLRYLDLSGNHNFERLPKEITRLHNLQTLLLRWCDMLKELPSDLSKLVKLSVLGILGCDALTFMPSGMDKLTALCILPVFIVAKVNSPGQNQRVGQLKEIEALRGLKGHLTIMIYENATYVKENGKGGLLNNKEHLSDLRLWWSRDENDEVKVHCNKAQAEDLQPHRNLKRLTLIGYNDVEKPSWAIDDNLKTFLPNLVSLWLYDCKGLEDLPELGRLKFLKYLKIEKLWNLEYVEKNRASSYEASTGSGTSTTGLIFFPSLEELYLRNLPKLKGWWRGDEDDSSSSKMLLSFPRLSSLFIWGCPHLTSMPLCPSVKQLTLKSFNERLRISKTETGYLTSPQLRGVMTDDARYLKSLPMQAFQCLSELKIEDDNKLENLSEVEEVFRSCSSSLRTLKIKNCRKLMSLTGALEHLTALHSLSLWTDRDAASDMSWLDEKNAIPWSALNQSLRFLDINFLPKGIQHLTALQSLVITKIHLETLPEWISCLSSLQLLRLDRCSRLKSLPDGVRKLTSLRQFELRQCSPDLLVRCQKPDGLDWPKIQHIPHFTIC